MRMTHVGHVFRTTNLLLLRRKMFNREEYAGGDGMPQDLILTGEFPASWAALTSLKYM
jgi:hypothetical protein